MTIYHYTTMHTDDTALTTIYSSGMVEVEDPVKNQHEYADLLHKVREAVNEANPVILALNRL